MGIVDENKQHHKEMKQAEYERNKAKYIERAKRWIEKNLDKRRESSNKYYHNHKEEYKRRLEEYKKNGVRRKSIARYYESNRDEILRKKNEYRRNHPEKHILDKQRRKARIISVGGSFSEREWLDLCLHYGNQCLRCGARDRLTIDHIVPISRGGSNNIDNVQPLCLTCNLKKYKHTHDYRPDGPWAGGGVL